MTCFIGRDAPFFILLSLVNVWPTDKKPALFWPLDSALSIYVDVMTNA